MEAAKLKKTKGTISKGKIKKTIKNVICRPDPVYWPAINNSEKTSIEKVLVKHRVEIPNFTKPHWNDIKSKPKCERPKAPPVRRVDGLLYGLSECRHSIENEKCSAVIIEALINPQTIVQPCINACVNSNTPVLCLENLKILTRTYFGIQTSCLGVKKDYLLELSNKILEISQNYKPKTRTVPKITTETEDLESVKKQLTMEVDVPIKDPYLYRTNKKTRVFVPSKADENKEIKDKFAGQEFIKLGESEVKNSKAYMRMMLKKISNNPNRVKTNC